MQLCLWNTADILLVLNDISLRHVLSLSYFVCNIFEIRFVVKNEQSTVLSRHDTETVPVYLSVSVNVLIHARHGYVMLINFYNTSKRK